VGREPLKVDNATKTFVNYVSVFINKFTFIRGGINKQSYMQSYMLHCTLSLAGLVWQQGGEGWRLRGRKLQPRMMQSECEAFLIM
jgi:hypothetical protein